MHKKWICLLLALGMAFCLCACGGEPAQNAAGSQDGTGDTTGNGQSVNETTADPVSANTEDDVTCTITLSSGGAEIDGSGAAVSGGIIEITKAGVYKITGTLSEGQILVDAADSDTVGLLLCDADITCAADAAINVETADKVVVTLEEGSKNSLSGGTEESGAALYSKSDLILTGLGSLTVKGANNGIHGKDDLTVESGTYNITAANDGLKGKDSVTVLGGDFTIDAGGDGIQSDNDSGEGMGVVTLSGGSFFITAGGDGVQAETVLDIAGGAFSVVTGGGSGEAPTHTQDQRQSWFATTSETESDTSCKGLKAGTSVNISGGTFDLDCYDDAVHSNGDATVSGGTFITATGDDGFHADGTLTVSGGDITVKSSYEGLEGQTVLISGGTADITASDDGVNAAGGDGSGSMGLFGKDSFTSSSDVSLCITGGTLMVDAGGDGLDSNGDLTMEGGTVIVNGPVDNGNGALDSGTESGGTCSVTGGTLIAVGASGMAESFDSSSTQCSFIQNFSATIAAGSTVTVSDSSGNVIFTFTATKTFNSVVFTSPELQQGETYTLTAGDQTATITQSAVSVGTSGGSGGGMGGGTGGHGGQFTPPDGAQSGGGGTRPTAPTDGSTPPDGTTPNGTAPNTGSVPDGTTPSTTP